MRRAITKALVKWAVATAVVAALHPSSTVSINPVTEVAPPPLPTGCSSTGLGIGVIPASAIIRVEGVESRVSFDRGWASYEGTAPGVLVAVCATR